MAVDFVALTQRAIRTAANVGATSRVTITRPKPAPNPVTGVQTGSAVEYECDADTVKPAKAARTNKAFLDARVVVYVAAADCTFAPAAGMTLQVGGKTYRIGVVEGDLVGGVIVGYTVGGAA